MSHDCCTEKAGPSRRRRGVLGLIGLSCAGFCLLGLPLLALVLPALGLAWLHEPRVMWGVLVVSLGLYAAGLAISYRDHRVWTPALLALVSAAVLVVRTAHLLGRAAEWGGVAGLLVAWLWDRRLSGRARRAAAQVEVSPGEKPRSEAECKEKVHG